MTTRSETITFRFDWRCFATYLEGLGLSRKWREDLLRYARRYGWLVYEDHVRLRAELRRLSPHMRNKVMNALSHLARFLEEHGEEGLYEELRRRFRRARLAWSKGRPQLRVLASLEDLLEPVTRAASMLEPRHYRVFAAFLLATGLRPEEAAKAWRGYWSVRMRYRDMVLLDLEAVGLDRDTKRAIVAMVHPLVDAKVPEKPRISLALLRRKWNRAVEEAAGKRIELYTMRRLHATLLLHAGVPEHVVDLLQGRPGSTILRQNYIMYTLYEYWRSYIKAFQDPLLGILGED